MLTPIVLENREYDREGREIEKKTDKENIKNHQHKVQPLKSLFPFLLVCFILAHFEKGKQ